MRRQIITRRGERKLPLACNLTNKFFKETWAFEPPVPEEFCIERNDNNWVETQFADFTNLLAVLFEKVTRMFGCRIFRRRAIIQLFLITVSGDPVILHAGKFSAPACDWSQMFHGEIETDVAIKFPVGWISWIPFVRAPDLPACVRVPRKRR